MPKSKIHVIIGNSKKLSKRKEKMTSETQTKLKLGIAELRTALSKVEDLGGEDTAIEVDVIRGNIVELEEQIERVVNGVSEDEEEGGVDGGSL